MNVVDIIRAKRDGERLTDEQLRWFIDAYTKGEVADEQAAALCMAIFFQGMQPGELAVWTAAMIESGERLDLSAVGRPTVDKHSTGGVGDKVSLILAPLVAACGAAVPQLSGRGLGHSGGTLDKLEAIPGWRSNLSPRGDGEEPPDGRVRDRRGRVRARPRRSQALRAPRRDRRPSNRSR